MSITATSGKCIAACCKNAFGSVKVSTFQPAESRSRAVDLRIEESSSSRYTANVSLLSATMFDLSHHIQNRVRLCEWSCPAPHERYDRVRIRRAWTFLFEQS